MNVMAIAPHPDDAEISIGGTLLSLAKSRNNVYLINLTNGEPTPHGTVEKRLKEAREADRILKIKKRIICDFPNRYLQDKKECREETAGWIRKFKPKIIFVPHHIDAHPDHIAASAIGVASRFYAKLTKTDMPGEPFYPEKMFFYSISHMKLNMSPAFIFPVKKDIFKMKLKAIEVYKSQFSYNGNNPLEYIEARGRYFGSLIGSDYGEPFYTPEVIGIKDFNCLT